MTFSTEQVSFTELVLNKMVEFLVSDARWPHKRYIAFLHLIREYNKKECHGRRDQLMRLAFYIAQSEYHKLPRGKVVALKDILHLR